MPEIVLLGGPGHGTRFQVDEPVPAYQWTDGDLDNVVYKSDRFVSPYPIPGWDFWPQETNPHAVKPWNRMTPWWSTRLYAHDDYKVIIVRGLANLSTALATHDYARKIRSDTECLAAQMNINAAVNVVLALISGRENKYTSADGS